MRRHLIGRAHPGPPAPFVVGAPRSGTTLLRLMLDAHPELTIPPETQFVHDVIATGGSWRMTPDMLADVIIQRRTWGDFNLDPDELRARFRAIKPLNIADALRAFYNLYAEPEGKPRWGDKTPGPRYLRYMPRIHATLPEARFLHLIRDGRDVALSALRMNWGPLSVREAADRWVEAITIGRERGALVPYMEVRFEDLVQDPEPTLRRACEFLDLPWAPAMLDYHERAGERLTELARDVPADGLGGPPLFAKARLASHALVKEPPSSERIGRWRTEMDRRDRAVFEQVAGGLLTELGYETTASGARVPRNGSRLSAEAAGLRARR